MANTQAYEAGAAAKTVAQSVPRNREVLMAQEPHKPPKRLRHKVSLMAAAGEGEAQIAHVIGVARETLRKHYADELANGRAGIRAQILEKLWSAANAGNVSAMKHLDARTSGDVHANVGGVPGKKAEQAKIAAQAGAGTEWGDDLKPIVLTAGRAN